MTAQHERHYSLEAAGQTNGGGEPGKVVSGRDVYLCAGFGGRRPFDDG